MPSTSNSATPRPYGVHPSVAMVQGIIAKMKDKTGRTIDEWVAEVKRNGPAGAKAALLPIHGELLRLAYSLGTEVKACPCQTMVPLYRHHVFAQIKPSTKTRVDLGLALGGLKKAPARLIDTGGFEKKGRITHRIGIAALSEIDAGVERWMRAAYLRDGG